MLMDQHKSALPPPQFSAVVNNRSTNCSFCKCIEDALMNMCVLCAAVLEGAGRLAAAQQYLLILAVVLAFVVLGPIADPVTGLQSG